jgi:hypothetical protein
MSEQLLPPGTQDPSLTVGNTTGNQELDTEALNRITRQALEPQVYFGKGLELTDYDREQLRVVVSQAKEALEPLYSDRRWEEFMELVDEGQEKGVLMGQFASHEGTMVPLWCIDGGPEATVRKARTQTGRAAIEVPSDVFNLYHWKITVESLQKHADSSDEVLRGRSTKELGLSLINLAHLLKTGSEPEQH